MADAGSPDIYSDFSEFYDIYAGSWMDDLVFYLEYAKASKTPVLEIGAGSGRLTIPLARTGARVIAVDISPSMLALLKSHLALESSEVRERVEVIEADACRLKLEKRYDLIMVPFYTFNYMLTPQAHTPALESMSAHLSPNGRLLIDVFVPLRLIEKCPTSPVLRVDTTDTRTGNKVRGWNIYTLDKENQFEFRRHVFEVTQPDGKVIRKEFTTQRRYYYPEQLGSIFMNSGLRVENAFAGYKRDEPTLKSEQLMYVLRHR